MEVKRGDILTILGQSAPGADISLFIGSDEEILKKTKADALGNWLYKFDTDEIDYGDHSSRARAAKDGDITTFSNVIAFKVGTKTVFASPAKKSLQGDVNRDGRINLIDFSIAAYWYKRSSPPASVDLNGDGKVNLVDFSIMAYYWTG